MTAPYLIPFSECEARELLQDAHQGRVRWDSAPVGGHDARIRLGVNATFLLLFSAADAAATAEAAAEDAAGRGEVCFVLLLSNRLFACAEASKKDKKDDEALL